MSQVVLYDEQIFVRQERGGISRFFVETILRLPRVTNNQWNVETNWPRTINSHALDANLARDARVRVWNHSALQAGKAWARVSARATRSSAVDLVHATYYAERPERARRGKKLVTSVFDMTPERFPELFPRGNPHLRKRDYVLQADLVVCISDATARDVLEIYGSPPGRLVTVPWAVSSDFTSVGSTLSGLPQDYMLFVGQRAGYKDFAVLLDALKLATQELQDVPLVVVGGDPFSEIERAALRVAGFQNRVWHLWPSDDELPAVYRGAKLFVFPSRYEGFGLPTLEAMASGTPAVLARSSSHIEVGGSAAVFFEPGNSSDLAAQLVLMYSDETHYMNRVRNGIDHAQGFSWDDSTHKLAAAYDLIMR